jgi:hypothetical protein
MTDPQAAWKQVSDDLKALGLKLKLHYEQAGGEPPGGHDLQSVLRELASTIENGFTAVGTAARDDAVRTDAGKVARSVTDALAASLEEAGQGLGDLINRKGRS